MTSAVTAIEGVKSPPAPKIISSTLTAARLGRQYFIDLVFLNTTRLFALVVLALLLAILVSLFIGSLPAMRAFGFGFLTSTDWDPVQEKFGALVPVFGTLVTSFIALLIGIPVSFGIALFLTELSPTWLKRPLGIAIELLAGIPSIIYGMWGLFVLAPLFADHLQPWLISTLGMAPVIGALFKGPPQGIGVFTAGFVLDRVSGQCLTSGRAPHTWKTSFYA